MDRNTEDRQRWQASLGRLEQEISGLPAAERAWMGERLARIAALQEQMHRFFITAGGAAVCRDCDGACCGCGRHHVTLVNLLGFLLAGEEAPAPDFDRTCPFLDLSGCRLPASRRPFNCVTFNCEAVEEKLPAADREAFYEAEKELRALYVAFDRRYAGSSLRGFLLRAETLGPRPFLDRI